MVAGKRSNSARDPRATRLVSSIPGRERWEVGALKGNARLARELEDTLQSRRGVISASANPVSGRVLIFYSPHLGASAGPALAGCLAELNLDGFFWNDLFWGGSAKPTSSSSPLTRIIKDSIRDRRKLLGPPALSVVGQTLALLQSQAFITIFNTARGEGPKFLKALGFGGAGTQISIVTGLSVLLSGANLLFQPRRKRAWKALAQDAQHNLRTELIAHIEEQDVSFFHTRGTGQIINLITEDTENVGDFVERAGDELIEKVLTIVASGTFLLITSPKLALLGGLSLPFILWLSRNSRPKVQKAYARQGRTNSGFSQMLENNLGGIAEVKSFTAEHSEVERLRRYDARRRKRFLLTTTLTTAQLQQVHALFSFGFALAAGYGGRLVATERLTAIQYFRAAFWFPPLLASLTTLDQVSQLYHQANDSAGRLVDVLATEPKIKSGPVRMADVRGDVVFENVSFGYEPSRKVIDDVSLRLRAGETLAIVGPTGSGKSTLLRLLLRFYDVDGGRITLDGVDVRELDLYDLRSAVSLVSQEGHLFEGTVEENVRFGQSGATGAEVIEALRIAGALELVESLPGGLGAQVGQRGQRLSGGQRQRIALARAVLKILRGASILGLDEATSHLDNETEAAVKRSLRRAAYGRSVIMIAHRLNTVRSADQIVVLDRGRIIEEGKHEDLLARKGLYASLWQIQNEDPFGGGLELRLRD